MLVLFSKLREGLITPFGRFSDYKILRRYLMSPAMLLCSIKIRRLRRLSSSIVCQEFFFDVNSVAIWEQFTIPAVSMANRKVSSTS